MPHGPYDEPTEPCPYCGAAMECDWCDVGVGSVQCGPYHCEKCGASEIGSECDGDATEEEKGTGFYRSRHSPLANTVNGALVDHKTAKRAYELGVLDPKPESTESERKSPKMKDNGSVSLHHGGDCVVPREVAQCPECGGDVSATCEEWRASSGVPTKAGLMVCCERDQQEFLRTMRADSGEYEETHRYWQSDWQPVIDAVHEWVGALE